jgi:hypothetical protein
MPDDKTVNKTSLNVRESGLMINSSFFEMPYIVAVSPIKNDTNRIRVFVWHPMKNEVCVESFELTNNLSIFSSAILLPNTILISGGKVKQSIETMSTLIAIVRESENNYKIDDKTYPNMKDKRTNHTCFVHFDQMEANPKMFVIGGSSLKSVEHFEIKLKVWKSNYPELNKVRERCSAMVYNQQYLFVFFGNDSNLKYYIQTIECLDLNGYENNKWEIVSLNLGENANMNMTKRYNVSLIYDPSIEPNKVLICGGLNYMKNETKDVCEFVFKSKEYQLNSDKMTLPTNSLFSRNEFLCVNNEFFNLNSKDEIFRFSKGIFEKITPVQIY